MIRTLVTAACLMVSGTAMAETFPVPSIDPHASSWGERGAFTLHYYGDLADGTACPPSPNALQFAVSGPSGMNYLTHFTLDGAVSEEMKPSFPVGQFCSLPFEGEVRFLLHHGNQARIRPSSAGAVEAATEMRSGRISVNFQTIMCIKAPCPPGYFLISVDGGPEQTARSIQLEDRSVTPAVVKPFDGRSFPFEFQDATLAQDGAAFRIIYGD